MALLDVYVITSITIGVVVAIGHKQGGDFDDEPVAASFRILAVMIAWPLLFLLALLSQGLDRR